MQNYKIWMKKAGSLFLCCILSGVGCISCNNAKSSIQTKQTENTQSGFSCGSGELTDIANYIGSPVSFDIYRMEKRIMSVKSQINKQLTRA